MQKQNCKDCNRPEGCGYDIPVDHYKGTYEETENTPHHLIYMVDAGTQFKAWKNMDGTLYVDAGQCIDVLENSGFDLCDNIDMDQPLIDTKIHDGLCNTCIYRRQQMSLF